MRALINTKAPLGFVLLEEIRPRLLPCCAISQLRQEPFSLIHDCIYFVMYNFRLFKSSIFFLNAFLRGHSLLNHLSCSPRKSGGPVLTSRALHSTALFCSELALLPKAEINQSWLRLSRNKSRPVQNWSLPSQNVIAWLSLRIN